jgi:hypothetical protein
MAGGFVIYEPLKSQRRFIMSREILEKPFDAQQIKQREGNFGKTLDYIEGHAVIQRLNDAFDAVWSFVILKHEILKDEVIVLGELSAGAIKKSQFGSSQITRVRNTGDMMSLADDLKAAATDSLKKCATMFGIALHLYNKDGRINQQPSGGNQSNDQGWNASQSSGNGGNGGNGNEYRGNGNANGNSNGLITAKQHNFILSLLKNKGIAKSEINHKCVDTYGSVLDYLSRADASSLISELQQA